MNMVKKLALYIHTLRYLKPIQIVWRLVLKVRKILPGSAPIRAPIVVRKIVFKRFIGKNTSYSGDEFTFLNQASPASLPIMWNDTKKEKLWLYNLHYFDYLNQRDINIQVALDIILAWIEKNDMGSGNGWEPYPLSLRIVNWIKFLSRLELPKDQVKEIHHSLYLQARFLRNHLEYNLLGNHLFKNCVALIFAGMYFGTNEANEWLQTGKKIFMRQIDEQVLEDSGHFERSPMYHAIFLEDVLDSLNLFSANNLRDIKLDELSGLVGDMCKFLADILHPDRELPFFNDCAFGIAATPDQLFDYAHRLVPTANQGHFVSKAIKGHDYLSVVYKAQFGLFILDDSDSRLIMDVGVIGPDYLPGHAHCDTLSYELSLFGVRCIVNSGTYHYIGEMRNYFRSTQSHNTVKIDNDEQHEIWSAFRVARRGKPFNQIIKKSEKSILISASYSGYKKVSGRPVHIRKITLQDKMYIVDDVIDGDGVHHAVSYIHLHPDVSVQSLNKSKAVCKINNEIFTIRAISDLEFEIKDGWYSEEFGKKRSNKILFLKVKEKCPLSLIYSIQYARS